MLPQDGVFRTPCRARGLTALCLRDLRGLDTLTSVEGYLSIEENCWLASLTRFGGAVCIEGNLVDTCPDDC